MNTSKIKLGQEILLQWFTSQPSNKATFAKSKSICSVIAKDISMDEDKPLYKILYPLVSVGLLEFQNTGYSLSPSIFLKGSKKIFGLNIPKSIQDNLDFVSKSYSEHLVILNLNETKKILNSEIPITSFDYGVLKKIKPISAIIKGWERVDLVISNKFQYLSEVGWVNANNILKPGVYRNSENSATRRYLYYQNNWYDIDSSANNFTDQNIAYTLGKVENKKSIFHYDNSQKILKINTFQFPIILIRCLIHVSEFNFDYFENELVLKNISEDIISQLKKILN
jgi:hypothetical protein